MNNISKKSLILLIFAALISNLSIAQPQLGEASVQEVIDAMTLEEKATIVRGVGWGGGQSEGPMIGYTETLVPGAAGTTFAFPRLGITQMVLADGPAGLRISPTREGDEDTYYCTAFPVATVVASTWDTELAKEIGTAMGKEVLEYGADILLAPALNIHRNPLCGRNFEYYSEDPLVSGKMAAAFVTGAQSQGVGTSIKHFVANNAETNRNTLNVHASERALREIYLEGFRIAVEEAQPWTVMSSYNLLNGTYTSEREDLLTDILRGDWGFEGFVMTDWGGGSDPVAQMKAGNDLIMPGNQSQTEAIIAAVEDGSLDEEVLDRNIENILNIILKSPRFNGYDYSNNPDLEAHAQVTRQAATDGMVLLKNENSALPLASDVENIAAFGNTSYRIISGGTGSGDVNEAYTVSLLEGLENANYQVAESLSDSYLAYIEEQEANQPESRGFMQSAPPIAEMEISDEIAAEMAQETDIALITIGRNSGEGSDREVEADFNLTQTEKDLIQTVSEAFQAENKKAIVVLNVGGVIETASWRDTPDAILLAWQGGQETGNSIADVISGNVTPSGKLTMTFPMSYSDSPTSETFPGEELETEESDDEEPAGFFGRRVPAEDFYEDGIYVGYRYFDTYDVTPAYEFGYGLSYTTFDFDNLSLSSPNFDNELTVTLDVTNTGEYKGREVVQLYLSAPAENLDKPEKELKGFAKTALLEPGESQTITLTLNERNLASYDPDLAAWVAEAGTYEVLIGASSKDIRLNNSFSLGEERVVKEVNDVLEPDVELDVWSGR